MIKVSEILLAVRSRLNDTDSSNYRWSNEELLDYINSSLADIGKELECFTHKEFLYVKEDTDRYSLPHDILRVLSVTIDNKPITIKSYEYMSKHKHNIFDLCVYFDEQSLFLYPTKKVEVGKKVEVDYKYIYQIEKKEDDINISKLAKKAILFHTCHLAFQINTSEKNSGKSTHYLNLYDKELSTLRYTFFKNKHSKDIKQKFKKV
ncbi:phage adaptor protein [Aliarcobacter cibarius]|uniref:Phage protein n=1 Tax=Aliarcobacter cibarius TaxID=255507 RepID=A0ABY2V4U0_9BACT|nr:DUF6682 family protein [Aliarcobacter cibarius]TLS99939.1 hypothetical protein FE247_05250 [Aliarcobacter cibarius]TLT00348.1 hypothetical protein FE245_05680 [Aliarcobacter cibarius]